MKYYTLLPKLFLLLGIALLMSCSDVAEQIQLTEDEYPRIIGNWPERADNGSLGTYSFAANDTLSIALLFTPSKYATGTWYVDGIEAGTGTSFLFTETKTATYNLKLIVSTPKYNTSREATIIVTE